MITFSVLSDSAVKLTFDGNSHYLQDGEITVPKNSLALVKDESELITFIKAATGDAYLSFHIEDTNFANYTELENWYKANMVSAYGGGGGGGGVTSGEVQTMIDNSISGKADTYYVNTALADKADTSAVTVSIEEAVSGKADESYVETALADKVDVSELEEVELAVAQSINVLAQSVSGKASTVYVDSAVSGKVDASYVDSAISGKADTSAVTEVEQAVAQSINVINQSLSGKASTAYVDSAVSGKQDTLIAGSGIAISGNVISSTGGGGGATYSAGTNISIDTANTINCTLNLVNGGGTDSVKMKNTYSSNGSNSFAIGSDGVKASGGGSFAGGSYSEANKMFSMAFGRYAKANNYGEVALGYFNKSNGSSTAATNSSGDTLFSVGNGTNAYGGEHNAFEIRQNGDIYCSDGTNDVKLQDTITATAENTTALGGLSLVKLTQVQYDALVTKDPDTLYIITNVVNNS